MLIESNFRGIKYDPKETIRLLNVKQSCFYWENGCKPVDIYLSRDIKTQHSVLVFIFNKQETKDTGVYDAWCKNKPEG